jgi:hypothetical protein
MCGGPVLLEPRGLTINSAFVNFLSRNYAAHEYGGQKLLPLRICHPQKTIGQSYKTSKTPGSHTFRIKMAFKQVPWISFRPINLRLLTKPSGNRSDHSFQDQRHLPQLRAPFTQPRWWTNIVLHGWRYNVQLTLGNERANVMDFFVAEGRGLVATASWQCRHSQVLGISRTSTQCWAPRSEVCHLQENPLPAWFSTATKHIEMHTETSLVQSNRVTSF